LGGACVTYKTSVIDIRKHQVLVNTKKCEFTKKSLGYLGHAIDGGELKIDPTKIEDNLKFPSPANIIEVRSFV